MTDKEMQELQPGDLIRHKLHSDVCIVTANYGRHVTAVKTYHMANLFEWDLVMKKKNNPRGLR